MLDPVELGGSSSNMISGVSRKEAEGKGCQEHHFETMKPMVLATWKDGFQVGFYSF